ncbi:MAG: bifunctional riboflavin kinase/FAD synthetase [Clostridia bacterium]|nr:bifunctional riboflavin kinase/FAD synthetase [Clostridia bacterium]
MIIYKLPECRVIDKLPEGCAIALGNFDGVHRGHQKLFELAGEKGHKKAAWTFTTLAKPGLVVPYLTDMKAKLALFKEYGLDYAVFEDFESVRNLEYDYFVKKYLVHEFAPARVVCGFNFRFGRGGVGDAETLRRLLAEINIDADILQPVFRHSKTVSSSAIRVAVMLGDMDGAFDLLGHPFSVNFPVCHGKELGRKLGIPTINQNFPDGHIIPRHGIYACTASIDGNIYVAVTNVGTRPTVSGNYVNCESHIINYSGDLYGKEVKIEFYSYLRDEMRFDSVDALADQIKRDIESAKDFFARLYGG